MLLNLTLAYFHTIYSLYKHLNHGATQLLLVIANADPEQQK